MKTVIVTDPKNAIVVTWYPDKLDAEYNSEDLLILISSLDRLAQAINALKPVK